MSYGCLIHHHHLIIYPLTARVVTAPQMISQPVSSIFSVLHYPLGLGELQAYPFPDVVFPALLLTALSSSPFHCASQDGSGQAWQTGDMTIPPQCASLCSGQEVFVWSDCLLDLGPDFLVGNRVFYPFISISLLMPLALFIISLVFSALTSMP